MPVRVSGIYLLLEQGASRYVVVVTKAEADIGFRRVAGVVVAVLFSTATNQKSILMKLQL